MKLYKNIMKKNILFVSQDQGSANALIPVVKEFKTDGCRIGLIAEKQSISAFKREGFNSVQLYGSDLDEVIKEVPDLVVAGASMLDSVEKKAVFWAKKKGIKNIVILDYWGNYWQRFTVSGEQISRALSDLILVPDEFARTQMLEEEFPAEKLIVTGNPYFDTFTPRIKAKKRDKKPNSVLFISQPIYQQKSYFSDLSKIYNLIRAMSGIKPKLNLTIKLHPKEDPESFKDIALENTIAWNEDIKKLLDKSDLIVGTDSSVLFEAVFSGKPVISYQPEPCKKDNLITNSLGLSYKVNTPDQLRKVIYKIVSQEIKNKSLPRLKYYNDGKCTERVLKTIRDFIT